MTGPAPETSLHREAERLNRLVVEIGEQLERHDRIKKILAEIIVELRRPPDSIHDPDRMTSLIEQAEEALRPE